VVEGVSEDGDDVLGAMEDVGVGEAQGAEACTQVRVVAPDVRGLRRGGAMVAQAVGLDHEAVLGPEEIDAVAAEAPLALGQGQAGGTDDLAELALQRALRATVRLGVEQGAQPGDTWALGVAAQGGPQCVRLRQAEPVGLVHRLFDFVRRQFGGEVDEDRDRIGEGDSPDIARRPEVDSAMQADLAPPAEGSAGTVTSISPPACGLIPQRSAALRWLSCASGPQARVAALKRPSRPTSGRPTA
jgi:hypothetical protein